MTPLLLDAAVSLGGLVAPPLFDFLKKKFVKAENDTPERTIGSLAVTKPEVLPDYIRALGEWSKAKVEWFNRDVIGAPSQWIVDLRAAIRPVTVVACLLILGMAYFNSLALEPGIRLFCEASVASWMGSRLVQR